MIVLGGPVEVTFADVQALIDRTEARVWCCGLHYFDNDGAEQVCEMAEGHS